MFDPTADIVFADGPATNPNNPQKVMIRKLLRQYEAMLAAGLSNGGLIYDTKANMNADLDHPANASAWVVSDGANNGIYRKSGASGSGSWTKIADLPYSVVYAQNDGSGTGDAVEATSSTPIVTTAYSQLISIPFTAANTGAMTLSINGETPRPLVTNTGEPIPAGYVSAGMSALVQIDGAGNYRLFSYGDAAAVQAAAEAAQVAAEGFADNANDSAVASASSEANSATSATAAANSKTQAELAALSAGAPLFASVAAGEAGTSDGNVFIVSTSAGAQIYKNDSGTGTMLGWLGKVAFEAVADLIAFAGHLGPEGTIVEAGGYRYAVAASAATDHDITSDGGVKLYVQPTVNGWNVRSFGAVGDGVLNDTAAIQKAIDRCAAQIGGSVHFPMGTYNIDAKLKIFGSFGYRGIRITGDDAEIVSTHAGAAIEFNPSALVPAPQIKQRSEMDGISFFGPGKTTVGSSGISIINGASVKVRNSKVRGYEKGLSGAGGLILRFHGLELYNNGWGYYLTTGGGFAPNDIHFNSCFIFENDRIGFAEKFPNGVITFNECEIEGNNATGTATDGIINMEFDNAGKVNLIGGHFELNPGSGHIRFAGGSISSSLNIVGGEFIPGDKVGYALKMDNTYGAYGHLTVIGSRIVTNVNPSIQMTTGMKALIIGDWAGNITGDLSGVVLIKNGKIATGVINTPASAGMRSKGVSGIAHDFEGSTRFVDGANNRLGYSGLSAAAAYSFFNDQDNQGYVFSAKVGGVPFSRFHINRSGVNGVEPGVDNGAVNGSAVLRWSTVYAGTGTINTSDEREKQQIDDIPDTWLDAWGEVEWQRFKWNDAVDKKGDAARWHVGLIAQNIHEVFAAHGLDAFEIGLLCHDEWEATEAVRDDQGNILTPALSSGDRWGVRYVEAQAMEAAWHRREIERLRALLGSAKIRP